MSTLRPAQVTNDALSIWMNGVQDNVNEHNLSVSSDFVQKSGPSGKFLSLKQNNRYTHNYMNYRGEWNAMNGYAVNDVVTVQPGKDYLVAPYIPWSAGPYYKDITSDGPWGSISTPNPALSPTAPTIGGTVKIDGTPAVYAQIDFPKYYPMPGSYVCVATVPSYETSIILNNKHSGDYRANPSSMAQYSDLLGDTYALNNIYSIRLWDVNYFPTWPQMPNIAVVNPYALTGSWGRYWDLLSLLPTKMNVCINGVSGIQYVDAENVPSGSMNYKP